MPALIVPSSTTGDGISLQRYRSDLAENLGEYEDAIVTSVATGPDARRYVITDAFRDDVEAQERFAGHYLYVRDGTDGGTQTRLHAESYEGLYGAMAVSSPFSAPLAVGTTVEVTSPLPVTRYLGMPGLNDVVNEALDRCRILSRLLFTGNDTLAYGLGDYPWLRDVAQTNGLYTTWGETSIDNPMLSQYRYRFRRSGQTIHLETPYQFSTSETFQLEVFLRAKQLVRQNGAWGYTTTGLVADSDEATAPLHWVRAAGMVLALRHVIRQTVRDQSVPADQKRALVAEMSDARMRWAIAFNQIRLNEMPQPEPLPAGSIVSAYGASDWPENIRAGDPWL